MEAVLFIGVQASGKSTFFKQRFFTSHVRVSLDLLRTRKREQRLLQFCLESQQPFVVDNTNPTRDDRRRYIAIARHAKFRISGYYFQSKIEDCKSRNTCRVRHEQVPLAGLLGTFAKLELPHRDEGFDELNYVRIQDNEFLIEEWCDEV